MSAEVGLVLEQQEPSHAPEVGLVDSIGAGSEAGVGSAVAVAVAEAEVASAEIAAAEVAAAGVAAGVAAAEAEAGFAMAEAGFAELVSVPVLAPVQNRASAPVLHMAALHTTPHTPAAALVPAVAAAAEMH